MIKEEISLIIKSRQSIYPNQFNGRIIPEDVILELLENANHAPSHKMTQPWIFKVFCGDSKKQITYRDSKRKRNTRKEK
jgi:nitroreductase